MSETSKNDPSGSKSERFEIFIAFLLGIAAILTAWAAFQSNLLSGDSQKEFTKAALSSDESSFWFNQGNQRTIQDQALWLEYAKAAQAEDEVLTSYIKDSLMDENLSGAIDWYLEQGDEVDSPFVEAKDNPYSIEEYEQGADLDAKTKKQRKEGERLDKWGDDFDAQTVLLAMALFLFGISTVFDSRRVQIGLATFGAIVLVIGAIQLIDLGTYESFWNR